jgi:hypothetical protein
MSQSMIMSFCAAVTSRTGMFALDLAQARIGRARVIDQNLGDHSIGQPVRQHLVAVELPVRIVGREQQKIVATDMFERAGKLLRVVFRQIERLERESHALADDVGRRPVEPRHLGAHAAPGLVDAPQQRRQPGKAGLDADERQRREFLENAFRDEAQ